MSTPFKGPLWAQAKRRLMEGPLWDAFAWLRASSAWCCRGHLPVFLNCITRVLQELAFAKPRSWHRIAWAYLRWILCSQPCSIFQYESVSGMNRYVCCL